VAPKGRRLAIHLSLGAKDASLGSLALRSALSSRLPEYGPATVKLPAGRLDAFIGMAFEP